MTDDRTAWSAPGDRRLGWLLVLAGATLALAVQVAGPVGVPLYDGVPVQEPYRFLHPTGDQVGDPTSFTSAPAVIEAGVSPAFAAATTENPPQAQLIVKKDAFQLPEGATEIRVSITPIEASAPPPGSAVAGNMYRFSVTDAAGTPLALKPCEGCRSLILRAPEGTAEAAIKRYEGGAWVDVETLHAGIVATYQANPTALGDLAVIAGPPPEEPLDPVLIVLVGGIVLVLAAVVLVMYPRQRSSPAPVHRRIERGSGRGPGGARPPRVPTKRRGPRRPPSGRSEP